MRPVCVRLCVQVRVRLCVYIVACTGGTRDEMTGSSPDDWILLAVRLQPLLITLDHNTVAISHTFSITLHQSQL
jgi:hypothetical protein